MQEELYLKIRKSSARYTYYLFFDTTPYLADQIFIRHEIRVRFGKEFAKEGSPYRGILCSVRKKDAPVFESCMEELKKAMILCGHADRKTAIGLLLYEYAQRKGMFEQDGNDAAQKAEQKETA